MLSPGYRLCRWSLTFNRCSGPDQIFAGIAGGHPGVVLAWQGHADPVFLYPVAHLALGESQLPGGPCLHPAVSFQSGDYQAWLANMAGRGITRFVNQTNFKEFAAAQLAAQNGDDTLLDAFRAKYGFGQTNGRGCGMGNFSNQ